MNRFIFLLMLSLCIGVRVCPAETIETLGIGETPGTGVADVTTGPNNPAHQPLAPAPEAPAGGAPLQGETTPAYPRKVETPPEAGKTSEGQVEDQAGDAETETEVKNEADVEPTETPEKKVPTEAPAPGFSLMYVPDLEKVDAPSTVTWTLRIENTGNAALTGISIDSRVPESFNGPNGDNIEAGVLDIGETWTFTGKFGVAQAVFDGNGVDANNVIDGDGDIDSHVSVAFAETEPQEAVAAVRVVQDPRFTVTQQADIPSIDKPKKITYAITIENTGNLSLSQSAITTPLLGDLHGPDGDSHNPGILDVDETWIYKGTYKATQEIIDGNGVDTYNVIDSDGDIDSTVMVTFAEAAAPQTAYATVAVNLSITSNIFDKKYRNLHGFVSVQRLYTTNLYKTDENPESCWATFLTPGIWVAYPSEMRRSVEIITANASPLGGIAIDSFNPLDLRRFQAYALYSPQIEIYHGQKSRAYRDPDLGAGVIDEGEVDQAGNAARDLTGQDSLDRLTHRLDAMLHYHSGNKLAMRAINQYKISYDAFSERAYWTDDKFTSNMFNIAGTLDLTERLQVRLDYGNFRLNYRDAFNRDDNRMDDVYAAYLFFRLAGKTSVFLEYDFADIAYETSPRDSHENRYFAGLRWEMTGKSSGQIKGGYAKKTTADSPMIDTDADILSDRTGYNWMAAVQLDHEITSRLNLTLNAYRRFDEVLEHRYEYGGFEDFYADYVLAHFGGMKLSWNVFSNIYLNLDASFFHDRFEGSQRWGNRWGIDEERKDLEFSISPTVSIDLFTCCSINGGYLYTDHDSNYPDHDYFDHTFFIRASLFI